MTDATKTTYATPDADAPTRDPDADRIAINGVSLKTYTRKEDNSTGYILSVATHSLDRAFDDKWEAFLPDFFVANPRVSKTQLSASPAPGRKQSDQQALGRLHNSQPLFVTTKTGETIINRQAGDFQRLVAVAALQGRTLNGEGQEDVYNAIYTQANDIDSFVAALNQVLSGVEAIQVRSADNNGFMRVRRIIPTTEQFNEKAFPKGVRKAWEEVSA